MGGFVPWNSQPLQTWAEMHAPGKFLQTDGYSTHYIEKGQGEPVILVHGFFYDSYMWVRNIDALAEHFKVFAIDLWGSGYSSRMPAKHGYPLYADQLVKFMDAMGIDRASLVGQSIGGGACIHFSAQYRHRVNKLILVSATGLPGPVPTMGRIALLPRVGDFLMGLRCDLPRKMLLRSVWFHDKALVTDDYFENVTRFHKISGTTDIGLRLMRDHAPLGTLLEDIISLGRMRVPTLLVWGQHDKAVPLELGQQMHAILRGSRLEVIERAGHCPQYEHSELFNELALHFLLLGQASRPRVEGRRRRVLQ